MKTRLELIKELAKKKKRKDPAKSKANDYATQVIRRADQISKLPCDYVIQ